MSDPTTFNFRAAQAGAMLFAIASIGTTNAWSQTTDSAEATGGKGLISLLDVAPGAYFPLKRYPKYYGDPNLDRATVDGQLSERQYLLGSMGGWRDRAAENGLTLDFGITQTAQGAVSGDGDDSSGLGSADLWIAYDTGRAGLWSGGLVIAHAEGNWGNAQGGTGALLPLNFDATMPGEPAAFALSELYLVQALPNNYSLVAGKVNFTGLGDKSLFANDERNQFLYTGLNNNAILGAYIPYTSLGLAVEKQFNEEVALTLIAASNSTNALSPGFDDLKLSEMTYGLAGQWTPTFGNLPGNYNFIVGYTTKDFVNYNIDERHLIDVIEGNVPIPQKSSAAAMTLAASQYLTVDEGAKRADGQPVGIGFFARFGIANKDRNVIDQFYSLGIGGNGGLFDRRDDSWGIGWAGTHFSSDLRRDLSVLGVAVDSFEHVFEGYYSIALTPAIRTSFHVQKIDSANPSIDDPVVLSARLQLDF